MAVPKNAKSPDGNQGFEHLQHDTCNGVGMDFSTPNGVFEPPSCNTGVNSLATASNVPFWRVDWLRVSFPDSEVETVSDCLLRDGLFRSPTKGQHGYFRGDGFRVDALSGREPDAFIWWGGDAQKGRATLEVPAACAERVFLAISRLSVAFAVGRVDLCIDFDSLPFLDGQNAMLEVLEAWPYRGTRPLCQKIDDMGQGTGSTFYVGRKSSECVIRWYEKGKQLRDPVRPNWCRFEIEMKPKKAELKHVYWQMLREGRRGHMVAGMYSAAFLQFFVGAENADKRINVPAPRPRCFDDRVLSMVTQYGGLLGEILNRVDGDRTRAAEVIFEALSERIRVQNIDDLKLIREHEKGDIPY